VAAVALSCEPIARLAEIIQEASGCLRLPEHDQVRYLVSYLRHPEAAAQTIIREAPYVDRHWLEEFAGYYATALHPPSSHATRLHFIRGDLTADEFRDLIRQATIDRQQIERGLAERYLGFCVVRPLPSAPIGRTALKTYGDDSLRCYAPADVEQSVRIAGLEIRFRGLPFQQQDRGLGACATTALWCALARALRANGQRPPSPLEVTWAALGATGASRPHEGGAGLDLEHMARAIRHFGFRPHSLQDSGTGAGRPILKLALKTYLRSGIPVVVRARVAGILHAVTLSGFRDSTDIGADDIRIDLGRLALHSRGVVRWYVHDDRLGPYARLELLDPTDEPSPMAFRLLPLEAGFEELADAPMLVSDVLVPLYPKLRLTAEELIEFAIDFLPRARFLTGSEAIYVEP